MDNGTCNCVTLPLLFSRLSLLRLGSAPSVVVPMQTAPASNKFFFTISPYFYRIHQLSTSKLHPFFVLLFFSNYALRGGGGLQNILASISIKEFKKKRSLKRKKKRLKK